MTTARLFRVIVPVSDIDRAAQFYERLLELHGKRVSPGRHYFDCGGTILACFDPRADGDSFDARPNPDHIYISVEDLRACHARAKTLSCLRVDDEIADRPWGETSFYAQDPFGNPICLVQADTEFLG